MDFSGNSGSSRTHRTHRTGARLLCVVTLLLASSDVCLGQAVAYVGALGGFAILSADAGTQQLEPGLTQSSYAPKNGGALDVFAGAHLHDYFSLQGDFIWNRNSLRMNSSSSVSSAFYQEDRNGSQEAGVVSFLLYFRQRASWIRPYLGVGTGIAHLSSASEGIVAVGGAPQLPPQNFSWTGPVLRTHVGIDLKLIHHLDFRYSFSETVGHNAISKNLAPPGSHGLMNFQNLFGFVFRF